MSAAVVKQCGYCPQPTTGRLLGDRAGRQAASDHEGCYDLMVDDLDTQDQAARAALEATRLEALKAGTLHPDDRALLEVQHWTQPHGHRHCDRCSGEHPTILVGLVETGSGAGGDIRNCRACVGIYLILARIQAEDHGRVHTPRIPGRG